MLINLEEISSGRHVNPFNGAPPGWGKEMGAEAPREGVDEHSSIGEARLVGLEPRHKIDPVTGDFCGPSAKKGCLRWPEALQVAQRKRLSGLRGNHFSDKDAIWKSKFPPDTQVALWEIIRRPTNRLPVRRVASRSPFRRRIKELLFPARIISPSRSTVILSIGDHANIRWISSNLHYVDLSAPCSI